jgi:hypothetical protein
MTKNEEQVRAAQDPFLFSLFICYVMLCYVMLWYGMVCYVMVCYVMLWYGMVWYGMGLWSSKKILQLWFVVWFAKMKVTDAWV